LPGRVEVKFERGFPIEVKLRVADFLVHGAALDAARPRPRVRVNQVADGLAGFVHSPHLGCVTEIGGYSPTLGVDAVFGDGTNLPSVDEMAAAADRLTRLEVLDLEGCWLDDASCDQLSHLTFPALVELDLSNNHITDVGVSDLLNCRLPRKLILGGNPITDQGAIELANRLGNSPVEYLNLRRTLIGQPGHVALLRTFDRPKKKVDLF
jgi:Leucine Rich repeat